MRKNWLVRALVGLVVAALCLGVAACGGPKYTQIGEATDDTVAVLVDNALGEAITGFSVRESGADAYPASLLADDVTIAADETAQLNYASADAATYDLAITTESGQVVEVANVALANLDQFAVHFEDGVGFFTHADADGNEVSTKEDALAAKAAAEKLAADTAAAEAVAQIALALPSGDALTLDSEDAIIAAREAYESLTDDQKALFSSDALAAIEAAESGLEAAKQAEAERIAAEEAAAAAAEAERLAAEQAAAEQAAAEEAARQQQQQQTYYSAPTYSAPTQGSDDCTSDTIALRP